MNSPVEKILDDGTKLARDLGQKLLDKLLAVLVDEPGGDEHDDDGEKDGKNDDSVDIYGSSLQAWHQNKTTTSTQRKTCCVLMTRMRLHDDDRVAKCPICFKEQIFQTKEDDATYG